MSDGAEPPSYRVGADENGLGARLGPLLVTAVLAEVTPAGVSSLKRKLPARISQDLGDSKRLVRHGNIALAEAWARAVYPTAGSPEALLRALSLDSQATLEAPCPAKLENQCWSVGASEAFESTDADVRRVGQHLSALRRRGVDVLAVKSEIVCVKQLNLARSQGVNRFTRDLHGMEQLVLAFHDQATRRSGPGAEVTAICGKVGAMRAYPKFFGPLSGRLHTVLEESPGHSGYRFPGLGEVHFQVDADASDPLVMLASLVGKYLRELLMGRILDYYGASEEGAIPVASGYNDPVSNRFVEQTRQLRRKRRVPDTCFERTRASAARTRA